MSGALDPLAGAPTRAEALIDRICAHTGTGPRKSGSGWSLRCPAHEDRNPSLSVTASRDADGVVLLTCHAGCDPTEVLAAVGLTLADLFPPRDQPVAPVPVVRATPPQKATTVEYLYVDEDGQVLFRVVRRNRTDGTKEIRQHARLADGWARSLGDARRVLYRLPEVIVAARQGTPIWVVEGEKCVEALRDVGLIATTNPGGAGKWDASYTPFLTDADVIILPDSDPPGRKHASDVADALRPVARRVRTLELPGLPEHGDIVDWLAAGHTARDLQDLADGLTDRAVSSSDGRIVEAEPVDTEPTWPWPTLAPEALYGPLGDLVRTLEPTTEADPAAIYASLLTAVGAWCGPGPRVMVGSTPQTGKLFSLIVGQTSRARKGTSWSDTHRALAQIDGGAWLTEHVVTGLSSGEGLINRIKDDDLATAGQGELDEIRRDKRLLVIEPEFGSVLRVTDRTGNTLAAVLREAWDVGPLQVLTRAEPLRATAHHIGLVGHITVEELRAELSDTLAANGFANRHLFIAARRPRLLPRPAAPTGLDSYAEYMRQVIGFARTAGVLERSHAAWERWDDLYAEVESREMPGMVGVLTHRGAAQILRIALILAIVDLSPTIEPAHLDAAAALWDYSEQTVLHVFGDALGDPVADRLLAAARAAGPDGLDGTAAHGALDRNVPAAEIKRAIALLTRLGLAEMREVPAGPKGGRPRRLLVAVR